MKVHRLRLPGRSLCSIRSDRKWCKRRGSSLQCQNCFFVYPIIDCNLKNLTGINTYTGDSNAFFTVAIGAKNTAVNVTGGKITAKSNDGYEAEYIFGHNADTSTGSKVNLDTELVLEGTNTHYLMVVYS